MWPWPGAFCYLQQADAEPLRLSLCRCELAKKGQSNLPPGTFDTQLDIVCGDGQALRILEVKPDNGKLMPFKAFANGKRVKAGERMI
jgi:methionyl-tRNA formyltransferase